MKNHREYHRCGDGRREKRGAINQEENQRRDTRNDGGLAEECDKFDAP